MITRDDVISMYFHLRATNQSISDEALDFMKNVCLEALEPKSCESCYYAVNDVTQCERHSWVDHEDDCTYHPHMIRNKNHCCTDYEREG